MNIYKRNKIVKVYDNLKITNVLDITDDISFSIPIKESKVINYLELFFSTNKKKCRGKLLLNITLGPEILKYALDLNTIAEGIPYRFSFNKTLLRPITEIGLFFKVEYTTSDLLSLCLNNRGVCATVISTEADTINLDNSPLISIITPVYKSNLNYLQQTKDSVLNQIYPNWEWCLIDDGSNDKKLTIFLKDIENEKIKVFINKDHKGISGASNEAINIATGKYICFLDHDDVLDPASLLKVAEAINKTPKAGLVYTDEDKINDAGILFDSFYKPDYSYHQLLSQNYICHLTTYDRDVMNKVYYDGYFHKEFDGSQDYDLALRIIEKLKDDEIVHIPEILYHWRQHPDSTAQSPFTKPQAHFAAMKALKEHSIRLGQGSEIGAGRYQGTYNVLYSRREKLINIIIPTKNNIQYLEPCIFSILESPCTNYFITIMDNGSTDKKTLAYLDDWYRRRHAGSIATIISYPGPFNYSAINNFAVENSKKSDLLLFLNDDTEVITHDWLTHLSSHIGYDNVAITGPKLLYPNNLIQHAGVLIGMGGVAGHSHKGMSDSVPGYFAQPHIIRNVSAVTGACLMVDYEVFKKAGGFEENLPRAFNDIDLCLKVRAGGYKIVYDPTAVLYHYESISRGIDKGDDPIFKEAVEFMMKKWDTVNYKDPYHNPNLPLTL